MKTINIQQNKYKEALPIDTINRIKNILYEIGIHAYEKSWNNVNDCCFSVALAIDELNVQVNGKGTTRLYALASAYAELMERLQTGRLTKRNFGNKKDPNLVYPDVLKINTNDFFELSNIDVIITNLLKISNKEELNQYFIRNNINEIEIIPFFNLSKNIIEYFPLRIFEKITDTTGLAAGNTANEALIQGISEIFERYVGKQIIFDEIELPTIPNELFKSYDFYKIIELLENAGYNIQIKDCSLNGTYPVIGVLIINENGTMYHFKLGASPAIEIAVERCLTELFQGFSFENIDLRLSKLLWHNEQNSDLEKHENFASFIRDGTGQFPHSIFYNCKESSNYSSAFIGKEDYLSNNKGINHMINILNKNNLQIYIKNYSYLGFPTYQIYIPGISENGITWNYLNNYSSEVSTYKKMLNIKKSEVDKLERLTYVLEDLLRKSPNDALRIDQTKILKGTLIKLKKYNNFGKLDLRFLLVTLYLYLGKYSQALIYLNSYIRITSKQNPIDPYLIYYQCIAAYIKLKINNYSVNQIKEKLIGLFKLELLNEVLNDMADNTKALQYMKLPDCPDCNNCEIHADCNYSNWAIIVEKLNNIFLNAKLEQIPLNF